MPTHVNETHIEIKHNLLILHWCAKKFIDTIIDSYCDFITLFFFLHFFTCYVVVIRNLFQFENEQTKEDEDFCV